MQISVESDSFIIKTLPVEDDLVKQVPLRRWSEDDKVWKIPYRTEVFEVMTRLGFPLSGIVPPTRSLFTVDLVKYEGSHLFSVSTPQLRAYIEACKAIPDYRAWYPTREIWLCKPTARNVEYLRRALPQLKWSENAQKFADQIAPAVVEQPDASAETPAPVQIPVVSDYKFKTQPRLHQAREFLLRRDEEIWACNWDMGTGKTKLTIDTIAWNFMRGRINAVLVVCPNGVRSTWEDEIEAHMPEYIPRDVHVMKISPNKALKTFIEPRKKRPTQVAPLKILVTNVEAWSSRRLAEMFTDFAANHDTFLVVDEYTRLKNHASGRTKAVLKLRHTTKMRRILSGTPVTQAPLDVYAPYALLDKSILGYSNWYAMKSDIAIMGGFQGREIVGYRNLDLLKEKIDQKSSRIIRSDCVDLPPKIYEKRRVQLTPTQRSFYDEVKENLELEVAEGKLTVPQAMLKTLRLQQIIGGFISLDPEDVHAERKCVPIEGGNPKLDALLDEIETAPTDTRVIIWARFRPELAMITAALREAYGADAVVEFHGGVPSDKRDEARRLFQDKTSPVRFLVGQVQAGGIGITLTAATLVVYYSNTYSLEDRQQSEDRAHRIGQNNQVTYVDLVADTPLDLRVLQALRSKKNVADLITGDKWKEWI